MYSFFASNIPFYALLDHRNKKLQYNIVTADAQEQYSSLESKSSYLHVMLWSLLALLVLFIASSNFK